MKLWQSAVFWLAVYLALVLTPLFVLLVGPTPGGVDLWWDFSIALGFAGLAMMGVQFILTARFKRATAPFGIDIIYYFHRYLGVVVLVVILAHPVILFIDNPALVDFLDPRIAPWHMTAGSASILALLALSVTSFWRKPLRLHYDGWRIAHSLLAVAAVVLAILHVREVGHYVGGPWKSALWTGIAASWIAVLGYVRIVKPWLLLRRPWRVAEVRLERGDAWTLAIDPVGHAGFTFEAGQFAWLTLRASPFAMREHPFSFSSSATLPKGRVEFTIKALGDFTRTIGSVAPGETAYVDGPFGGFTVDRHPAPGYVFLAGGIGIAPIVSMLRTLADRGDRRPLLLVYAYRRTERLTFREDLDALGDRLALDIVYVLEEPPENWTGERGRITADLLDRHLPGNRAQCVYFICGPAAMIQAMEADLSRLGIPLGRIHSELFDLV
jgi:predicted ferric reductase